MASAWFKQLAREADLPPIRLPDLRHGAASLMLAANVDIKVVSELLGHSGTTITPNTCTSVFDPLKRQAVQAAAALMAAAKPWTESECARSKGRISRLCDSGRSGTGHMGRTAKGTTSQPLGNSADIRRERGRYWLDRDTLHVHGDT